MGGTQGQVGLAVSGAALVSVALVVVFDGGPAELVFMLLLLVPLSLGLRHVVVAARRARREGREAQRLAAADPARVAAQAVAEERRRLAIDVQTAVRTSVTDMRALALAARADLPADPRARLEAIAEHGRHAMTDLRVLLGLLREPPDAVASNGPPDKDPSRRVGRTDVAIGAVAVIDALLWIATDRAGLGVEPITVVGLALTGAVAGTALLRTIAPGVGAVVAAAMIALGTLAGWPVGNGAGLSTIFLFGGLVWACASRERSLPWAVAGPVALTAALVHKRTVYVPEDLQITIMILGAALLAGTSLRIARRRADRAAATAGSRRAELREAAQEAMAGERRTVARDLHDGVSGGVGVVVMQAGAAAALWESDQPRARRALDVVIATCDTTLREVDQLVQLDRPDDEVSGGAGARSAGPARTSSRGPHDLELLVERMRAAGLDVSVTFEPAPGPAPDPSGWSTAFRVVQESLTNVLRHAPGAHVDLSVRQTATGLDVEVVDDGPGYSGTAVRGYGLVGLSERVEQVGGTFDAGRGADGFCVRAHIPRVQVGSPAGQGSPVTTAHASDGSARR